LEKILITGGNGFIAKSLFEVFVPKYSICTSNRQELDLLDATAVLDYISKGSFDVIIHTATYDAAPSVSKKNPTKVLENNLKMYFNIARCEKYFNKMIYFGSGAEFNKDRWIPNMGEDYFDQFVPSDQYGLSKYIMSKFALNSTKIFNLRLFGLFGKYDDWRYRLIPNLCVRALFDMPLAMNQNRIYDFMYIDDLINIIKWAIEENPKEQVYNICSGNKYDFNAIARMIRDISNKDLNISFNQEGHGVEYSGDNSLLLSELKDYSFKSMKDSISELYKWYGENRHLINKNEIG